MKKRRIIVLLSACLVIGSVSVYAASPNPNIETMQNVGQLFKSYENNTDDSIFAKGKSGGIITKKDIEQATEFYILAEYDKNTAREKAIDYMLKRDATYQKAISEGYTVTDDELWAYLEELKNIINEAVNKEEAQALINQFDSEEEYWQHEFEVYKINLPIEKYLEAEKKEYLEKSRATLNEKKNSTDPMEEYNEHIESIQNDLVESEQYEIME